MRIDLVSQGTSQEERGLRREDGPTSYPSGEPDGEPESFADFVCSFGFA